MSKLNEQDVLNVVRAVVKWRYGKYNTNWFEFDELVNAIWVTGNVQKMPDIKMVWGRAKWDMMDYIRKETGIRFGRRYNNVLFLPTVTSLDKPFGQDENGKTVAILDILRKDFGYEALVDREDFLTWLFRKVTNNEREFQVLTFMFRYELNQEETSKKLEVSASRVSQIYGNLILRLKSMLLLDKYEDVVSILVA